MKTKGSSELFPGLGDNPGPEAECCPLPPRPEVTEPAQDLPG